jgi:hypothetical protein
LTNRQELTSKAVDALALPASFAIAARRKATFLTGRRLGGVLACGPPEEDVERVRIQRRVDHRKN